MCCERALGGERNGVSEKGGLCARGGQTRPGCRRLRRRGQPAVLRDVPRCEGRAAEHRPTRAGTTPNNNRSIWTTFLQKWSSTSRAGASDQRGAGTNRGRLQRNHTRRSGGDVLHSNRRATPRGGKGHHISVSARSLGLILSRESRSERVPVRRHVPARGAPAANGLRWSAIAFWKAGRASQRS